MPGFTEDTAEHATLSKLHPRILANHSSRKPDSSMLWYPIASYVELM